MNASVRDDVLPSEQNSDNVLPSDSDSSLPSDSTSQQTPAERMAMELRLERDRNPLPQLSQANPSLYDRLLGKLSEQPAGSPGYNLGQSLQQAPEVLFGSTKPVFEPPSEPAKTKLESVENLGKGLVNAIATPGGLALMAGGPVTEGLNPAAQYALKKGVGLAFTPQGGEMIGQGAEQATRPGATAPERISGAGEATLGALMAAGGLEAAKTPKGDVIRALSKALKSDDVLPSDAIEKPLSEQPAEVQTPPQPEVLHQKIDDLTAAVRGLQDIMRENQGKALETKPENYSLPELNPETEQTESSKPSKVEPVKLPSSDEIANAAINAFKKLDSEKDEQATSNFIQNNKTTLGKMLSDRKAGNINSVKNILRDIVPNISDANANLLLRISKNYSEQAKIDAEKARVKSYYQSKPLEQPEVELPPKPEPQPEAPVEPEEPATGLTPEEQAEEQRQLREEMGDEVTETPRLTKDEISAKSDAELQAVQQAYTDAARAAIAEKRYDDASELGTQAQWHREELQRRQGEVEPAEPSPIITAENSGKTSEPLPVVENQAAIPRVQSEPSRPLASVQQGAKVRVGNSPQLHTVLEDTTDPRFPDESIFRVKNDRTGDVFETDGNSLTPVKERTSDQKTPRTTRKQLDDTLQKAGLDPSVFPDAKSKKSALDRLDAKLAQMQTKLRGKSFTGITGLEPAIFDAALTAARTAIKAGKSISSAIQHAIEWIKANHPEQKFSEDEFRGAINDQLTKGGTHGIAARVLESRSERGTIGTIESGKGTTGVKQIERGRELYKEKGAEGAEAVMRNFEESGRFSSDDLALARAHGEALEKAASEAANKHGHNSPEYKAAFDANDDWARRVKGMATESHKEFVGHQGETDVDTGDVFSMEKAHKRDTGEAFTDEQRKTAAQHAQKNQKANEEAKQAEEDLKQAAGVKDNAPVPKTTRQKVREALSPKATPSDAAKSIARNGILDAAKKRVQKQIDELQRQIESGEAAKKNGKSKPLSDAELDALRAKRDDLKQTIADMEKERQTQLKIGDLKARKNGDKWTPEHVQTLWRYARENFLNKGVTDLDKIAHQMSHDLGMSAEDIKRGLTEPAGVKKASDALYAAQAKQRLLKAQAMNWLQAQKDPMWLKLPLKVRDFFFSAMTFGHGSTWIGTHTPSQLFDIRYAPTLVKDWLNSFKMAYKLDKGAFHESVVRSIESHPLFDTAKRAGLVVDPKTMGDEFQSYNIIKHISTAGNRGFDAMKLFRMQRFAKDWMDAPSELKSPENREQFAKFLADQINHATGSVRKPRYGRAVNETLQTVFFAPKLVGSQIAWLFKDPAVSAHTLGRWLSDKDSVSTVEKYAALSELKGKLYVAGAFFSALAVNQAILSATGSPQSVNLTNPRKGDFLAYKIAGHDIGIASAGIGLIRFLARELHAIAGERNKYETRDSRFEQAGKTAADYARYKFSPAFGLGVNLADRHDVMGNTLPFSDERPKYRESENLTWGQFATYSAAPIPIQDLMKEVWKGKGASDDQVKIWMKALMMSAPVGTAGFRVNEDYSLNR